MFFVQWKVDSVKLFIDIGHMYEDNLRDIERFGNPDDLVKGDGL